ncbi:hypothetical protein V1477_014134 [Vespula maculifrons]|uniref:Uncharacterized protein n=1 Tax=Vespula maculifrons TaxID=7453 RepID=A0ABD2BK63_VESMC
MLHDRSCLDMSEADGVDGGAICKRGFIHLQFAAKLEAPEAERHLDTTGRVSRCLKPTVWTVEQSVSGVLYISSLLRSPKLPKRKDISPVGPKVQQPPRGGTWVGDTCRYIEILWDAIYVTCLIFAFIFISSFILCLCQVRHDRSCLEMSEADGVDSGAICKRGFIHLQFAEKPEAPEAERHLERRLFDHAGHANFTVESPLARGSPDTATSKRWDLERRLFDHAGHANFTVESPLARGSPDTATSKWWDLGRHDRSCLEMSEADVWTVEHSVSILGSGVCRESTTGCAEVVIEASDVG